MGRLEYWNFQDEKETWTRFGCLATIAKWVTVGAGVASAILTISQSIASTGYVCMLSMPTSTVRAADLSWSVMYPMGFISIQFSFHLITTCPDARHWSECSCIKSGTSTCDGLVACNSAKSPTKAWVSAIELPTPMLACRKDLGRTTEPVTPIAKIASIGCKYLHPAESHLMQPRIVPFSDKLCWFPYEAITVPDGICLQDLIFLVSRTSCDTFEKVLLLRKDGNRSYLDNSSIASRGIPTSSRNWFSSSIHLHLCHNDVGVSSKRFLTISSKFPVWTCNDSWHTTKMALVRSTGWKVLILMQTSEIIL